MAGERDGEAPQDRPEADTESTGSASTSQRKLPYLLLALAALAGLSALGLATYAYFALGPGTKRTEIAEVDTSELVTRTSQGEFLDRNAEVHPETEAAQMGYRAPDFALSDFQGREIRLSEFRGTPVLLNFWATWCPPCRKEMPELQAFHEQYGDRIAVLGINWEQSPSDARSFLDKHGITYPNLLDRQGKVFVEYGLTGLPTSFWIDAQGVIRGFWQGTMDVATMVDGFRKTTRALEGSSER